MNRVNLKAHPEVKAIILAADPTYRKREACVLVQESVSLYGTYWSGGSRSTYAAVDLATKAIGQAPQYAPRQFGGPATTPTCDIPQGVAIVRTGIFDGKTATAYVYVNPRDVTPALCG